MTIRYLSFGWDIKKETQNITNHGVDFKIACEVFRDKDRIIISDEKHSEIEDRFFCIGLVGEKILTVHFTIRLSYIRIIGAGIWRKGRKIYEKENKKN